MPEEEVVDVAKWAFENGIYNIMLQVSIIKLPAASILCFIDFIV